MFETSETPGLAIAIAERGKPTVIRTYGVRRMGEPARIDAQTMFSVGSTTKAFTSAVLAMLVDEGKLTWDTKVVDVLPGFRMYDPYASAEMTVRDLLVHRSGLGLGAGDLMYLPTSTLSRAEIVRKLRYIKPATSFRSGYAYDNLLYVVAGELIAAVCNDTWENVVQQRILTPLQMTHTTTSSTTPAGANKGWPHARTSGAVRGAGPMALSGTLEHVLHDTFRTRWSDRTLEDAYVTFSLQPDGAINTATLMAISPLADFSFDFHDLLLKPLR